MGLISKTESMWGWYGRSENPSPAPQETDLEALKEGEWEGKMSCGHICLLSVAGGAWPVSEGDRALM